ncbi:MAG: site-2 protease family protein [Candidatus Limnocylindrales bacterium]
MSITPSTIILIAIFLLVSFPVHEFFHAFVAYRLGDATAKMYGRLTLNPIVHFDPFGGLFLVVSALFGGFLFGWAKPTPVNPSNLRDRRNGEVWVAIAGPLSNLLLAGIGAIAVRIVVAADITLPGILDEVLINFVFFNVALAIFNLIPVPPLDGSAILFRLLPLRTAYELRPILNQYGFLILLVAIIFLSQVPIFSRLVTDVTRFLVGF